MSAKELALYDPRRHSEAQEPDPGASEAPAAEAPSIASCDPDPVEQLAAVYRDYPALRATIRRRVQDPQLAADILQDAAVTTLEKLRAGEIAQPSGIGGYLYRVALNHVRNYRRKDRGALSSSAELELLQDDHDEMLQIDRTRWAKAARLMLAELKAPRDRELLVRFYLNDESKESICSSLGLSGEYFDCVLARARNRFRALLERRGFEKVDLFALALVGFCMSTLCSTIVFWPFSIRIA
jgi:RNA polymerase sigma-70 factor, ECF subfamily